MPGRTDRKRILVVNCYFDDTRRPVRRTTKIPQAMGPVYLAGAFSPARCDVKLYSELASGPLEDERLLAWPDLLVLTGLTNSFDRMLHLTAYARTKNPRVAVVAGGPPVRNLPRLAARFFDYCCAGDVEQMREVVVDALGAEFAAEEFRPRYDLAYWTKGGLLGYVESSRYCNFRCSFCALTGEGRDYRAYDLADLRRQIELMGKKKFLILIDNNFYGGDRAHFASRVRLLGEMRDAGHYESWGALATGDFFLKEENIRAVRAAGCGSLFSGVESFDPVWLRNFNKLQNTVAPQAEVIQKCLELGLVFTYGMVLDVTARRIEDLRRELDYVLSTPSITLPSFLTSAIPLLGTPHFFKCLAERAILPRTKLRDMDGLTLLMEPVSGRAEAVKFLRDIQGMSGYRRRVARHSIAFARKYRGTLTARQLGLALGNAAMLAVPASSSAMRGAPRSHADAPRTYVSTTEPLDRAYTPAFRVDSRYAGHFRPVMVTDDNGEPSADLLAAGLLDAAPRPSAPHALTVS